MIIAIIVISSLCSTKSTMKIFCVLYSHARRCISYFLFGSLLPAFILWITFLVTIYATTWSSFVYFILFAWTCTNTLVVYALGEKRRRKFQHWNSLCALQLRRFMLNTCNKTLLAILPFKLFSTAVSTLVQTYCLVDDTRLKKHFL